LRFKHREQAATEKEIAVPWQPARNNCRCEEAMGLTDGNDSNQRN